MTIMPAVPRNVGLVADRYVRERRQRSEFSPDTVKTVRSILHRFVNEVGREVPVATLTKLHVRRWWSTLEVGPSTARNQLSTVRTFLRWCVDEGLLRSDPTRGLKAPREPRRVPRTLLAPATTTLLCGLPDSRARLVVLWMLHLGLRCGEVARIQVGDIDRDARLLVVRGKGGHQRVLPVPDEAWAALTNYLAEHPATSGPLVRRYDQTHRGLSPHYVSDLVRRWMREAGVKQTPLDGVSGHALRRTCASDLLDGGAHLGGPGLPVGVGLACAAMQQWEHHVVTAATNQTEPFRQELTKLGAEGWEVVGITMLDKTVGINSVIAVLKRPIESPIPLPAEGTAPEWYADPTGRFDKRYFDGRVWTAHVGTVSPKSVGVDAPVA